MTQVAQYLLGLSLGVIWLPLQGCLPSTTTPPPPTPTLTEERIDALEQPDSTSASPETKPLTISPELPIPVPVTKPWKIAYVLKTLNDPYWLRVGQAAQEIGKELSVQVQIVGPENPPNSEFVEEQIVLISNLLDQEDLDGIVVGPADSIRLVPIIEKAIATGIKVIALDTPVGSEEISTFVGFDNFLAGKSVGQWVVGRLGGSGNVLILEGPKHHDNAIERQRGFLAGLSTGKIRILASQSANWNLEEAQILTAQWLAQYPEIDAIMAANDNMALGAVAAIEAGNHTNILVSGFDGSEAGLAAIQAQQLEATIDQPPEEQSRIAMQLMIHQLENNTPLASEFILKNSQIINLKNSPPLTIKNKDQTK